MRSDRVREILLKLFQQSAPKCARKTSCSLTFLDDLLTFEELLNLLRGQYSRKTIYRWIGKHGFPRKKLRGKNWFPKAEVLAWLEKGKSK
jgi:predicted DNA-binding transcriptional regulator AlpA